MDLFDRSALHALAIFGRAKKKRGSLFISLIHLIKQKKRSGASSMLK